MKTHEEKQVLYACVSIFALVVLSIVISFTIYIIVLSQFLLISMYIIFFITLAFVCFYLVRHFLAPLVQTKYFLELLLKDTLHELNIPLSVIKANVQMLKNQEYDSKKCKRLERIELGCAELKRLYQDIDYYIKREVHRQINEAFSLKELLNHTIEKFLAQDEDICIKVEFLSEDVTLWCDKHGFARVLDNILSNAIKYNREKNGIIIRFNDNRLQVIDEGIGMNEAQLFRIFDRYYQHDESCEGFGIGLSIVKAYCDTQKIMINIISKLHVGTSVSLDLKNIISRKTDEK
ncbi:MAG: sensor histidine kinase [Sulfurospirillum sp.]|nr:sensor histidine kinase [Sulfurospirillum sp.]